MRRWVEALWVGGGAVVGISAIVAGIAISMRPTTAVPPPIRIDDPERIIDLAFEFIEEGAPERLPELIYAESPEMEAVLARIGSLLASVTELGAALETRFPDETARIRESAASELADSEMFQSARNAARDGPDERFLSRIFVDPFASLRRFRDRIDVVYISDDARAILVDGQPAFGVGLTVREYDIGWRIALPTTIPVVSRYMPQSRDEWTIVASMVTVIDNAIKDLTADVRSGRIRNLDDAARRAGDKAWAPLVMTVVAYQRAMEIRSSGE